MNKCCKDCIGDWVHLKEMNAREKCKTPACSCHPKQSTELEEILREFDRDFLTEEGIKLRDIDVSVYAYKVKDLMSKAYHSGHTAGQAEERRKHND